MGKKAQSSFRFWLAVIVCSYSHHVLCSNDDQKISPTPCPKNFSQLTSSEGVAAGQLDAFLNTGKLPDFPDEKALSSEILKIWNESEEFAQLLREAKPLVDALPARHARHLVPQSERALVARREQRYLFF
jgi:hypothetical protein